VDELRVDAIIAKQFIGVAAGLLQTIKNGPGVMGGEGEVLHQVQALPAFRIMESILRTGKAERHRRQKPIVGHLLY
jgi:hypothetical protein